MRNGLHAMDANLLVALHVLLEQRNLTRASEVLVMSRPAVSTALRKLREHFGDELLVRAGRGMDLTELGKQLRAPVAEAVAAAESLLSEQRPFDPATSDARFSAAMSDYAVAILGGPLVRLLSERAPHCTLQVDVLQAARGDLDRQLQRHDLLVGPRDFDLPGTSQAVFADELVCVVSADHPALVDGALSERELRALPRAAVSMPWQAPGAFALDGALAAIGVTEQNVVVQVDRLLALPFAVVGSRLCAFMPSWLARRYGPMLDLVIARTPLAPVPMIEAAYWNPRRESEPGVQWLRGLVTEASRLVIADLEDAARDVD